MFAFRMRPFDDFLFTPASSVFNMDDDDWEERFWKWNDDFADRRNKRVKCLSNDDEKKGCICKKNDKKCRNKNCDLLTRWEEDAMTGFGTMDMKENDKEYQLSMDLPGLNKEDIKLSFDDGQLIIEGERSEEKTDDKIHRQERHFGSFYRSMSMPENVDETNVSAIYENGVLKVIVPKKEVKSAKKMITVN